MKRLHLFEFEDQPWLPSFLRNAMTAYLASAYTITNIPALWAEEISKVIQATGQQELVDLGSGSSGPIPLVAAELRRLGHPVNVTLTDFYPRPFAGAGGIRYWPSPVDARSVPEQLRGVRTMFASFHHFDEGDAARILANAAAARAPICVFEGTSRTAAAVVSSLLIPLLVLILTPRVKNLSWQQLVFTYLIPVLPILIFWDGLVSHLRTYSAAEMLELAQRSPRGDYQWKTGAIAMKGLPGGLPFLTGWPTKASV